MFYLTCTIISSIDLHIIEYLVLKIGVYVDCGTILFYSSGSIIVEQKV